MGGNTKVTGAQTEYASMEAYRAQLRSTKARLNDALRSGQMTKPKHCQRCGWEALVPQLLQPYFKLPHDYTSVQWLCARCYRATCRETITMKPKAIHPVHTLSGHATPIRLFGTKANQGNYKARGANKVGPLARRRIIRALLEGKTEEEAGMEAGFKTPATARNAVRKTLDSPVTQNLLSAALEHLGLTDEALAGKILELMNATMTVYPQALGGKPVVHTDNRTQATMTKLATQVKGYLVDRKHIDVQGNIHVEIEYRRVAELTAELLMGWYNGRNGNLRRIPDNILKDAEVLAIQDSGTAQNAEEETDGD